MRLTDFDRAVLAAAKMGALTQKLVRIQRTSLGNFIVFPIYSWFMGDVRVDTSISRLRKANQLAIGSALCPSKESGLTLIFLESTGKQRKKV